MVYLISQSNLCCKKHNKEVSRLKMQTQSGVGGVQPAALHLTAHSGCSFLFHYSLQYLKLIRFLRNAESDCRRALWADFS